MHIYILYVSVRFSPLQAPTPHTHTPLYRSFTSVRQCAATSLLSLFSCACESVQARERFTLESDIGHIKINKKHNGNSQTKKIQIEL